MACHLSYEIYSSSNPGFLAVQLMRGDSQRPVVWWVESPFKHPPHCLASLRLSSGFTDDSCLMDSPRSAVSFLALDMLS